MEVGGRVLYQHGQRPVSDLSAAEVSVLEAAMGYPVFGIHADAIADDTGLPRAEADRLIEGLADDGFLVEAALVSRDADGRRCWSAARCHELGAAGIEARRPADDPTPEGGYEGALPEWLWASFWNHSDPSSLRVPSDADQIAVRLLGSTKCGLRQWGWALRNLPTDSLRAALPATDGLVTTLVELRLTARERIERT